MEEPAGHRLHHQGQPGVLHQAVDILGGVGHRLPAGGGDHVLHHPLGQVLIHGDSAAQVAGAGIGNAHQLQGGLHFAVLAAGAVESQEHNVRHLAQLQHVRAEHAPAVPRAAGTHLVQIGSLPAHLLECLGHRGVKKALVRLLRSKKHVHQPLPGGPAPAGPGSPWPPWKGIRSAREKGRRPIQRSSYSHLVSAIVDATRYNMR